MIKCDQKILEMIRSDNLLSLIARTAGVHNVDLYIVGGFLRDTILGTGTRDIDFAVIQGKSGFYRDIEDAVGHRIITFRKKGIINRRIAVEGRILDFVDATKKGIEQELSRRDFTINSIAFSLKERRILDPQGGCNDLKEKIIKRNRRSVFRSDPLRMMRAVRLTCEKDDFVIEEETYHQIKSSPEIIARVSRERIREELDKIMESPHASQGFALLAETGLLRVIAPEFVPLKDFPQGRRHAFDVWAHTLKALSCAENLRALCAELKMKLLQERDSILALKYAILFHDIAKPQTFSEDEKGNVHFFHHEELSAVSASRIMKRLKFPTAFIEQVKNLIELHLRPHLLAASSPSDRALARLIAESGKATEPLALLALADAYATARRTNSPAIHRLKQILARLLDVYRSRGVEISRPTKLLSGKDVMKILALQEGPCIGQILKEVHDLQITGEITTRQQALLFLFRLRDKQRTARRA